MREKPILFNTDMVRAILEGRKTVTRRVVKGLGNKWHYGKLLGEWGLSASPYIKDGMLHWELQIDVDESKIFKTKHPYQVGDILWVREAWKIYEKRSPSGLGIKKIYGYKTDENNPNNPSEFYETRWQRSIHMPREAARIFLKVTDVRVERLQDMTVEQIIKEGFGDYVGCFDTREPFIETWNSTIRKKDLGCYSWNANPWVWVYEFERVEVSVNNEYTRICKDAER